MHHDHLARGQPAQHDQVEPGGEERLGNGGGLREAQAARDGHRLRRGHASQLRVATPREQRHHAIAAPEWRGRLQHLAGDLQAQDVRFARGRRIASHPLQQIGAVHARCTHAHQQVSLARPGIGDLGQLQHLGPTRGLDDDGAHPGRR